MERLKKCPFCGSEAEFVLSKQAFDELVEEHGSACLRIDCTNRKCRACMWVHHDVMDYEVMVKMGIKNWNQRAYEK